MTDGEQEMVGELLLVFVALVEGSAKFGLDTRQEAAQIVGEVCDALDTGWRPEWAAPRGRR